MTNKSLGHAIASFCAELFGTSDEWYQWRKINEIYLPNGIHLSDGSQYERNVDLKIQLGRAYASGSDEVKRQLTHYYIAIWGGVRGNKLETISNYALNSAENLIEIGTQGVASWSKALCVRNPHKYAIYDARVAVAINALQITREIHKPRLFPLIASRNKAIISGMRFLNTHVKSHQWIKIPDSIFYSEYINLITESSCILREMQSGCSSNFSIDIYTVEMALFSQAINLINEIIIHD